VLSVFFFTLFLGASMWNAPSISIFFPESFKFSLRRYRHVSPCYFPLSMHFGLPFLDWSSEHYYYQVG
jgi:hypothetical protein